MKAVLRSDVGRRRSNNEDSVHMDIEAGIFLLADGMGGHQAGEVASKMAVQQAYQFLKSKVSAIKDSRDYREYLIASCIEASACGRQAAQKNSKLRGMGTTLLLLIVQGGRAYLCNVGDSRAYLFRQSVGQITRDQTVGAFLVEHNLIKPGEIDPRYWHVLTQAVGSDEDLTPEYYELNLRQGDLLILCSDGLTDMLSDCELATILAEMKSDLNALANSLVSAANENGGYDNVSVIVIDPQ